MIGHDNQGALSLQTYDFSLHPRDRILIPFAETGIVNYWPSSIIHTGDYIVFAAIGRNPQQNWPADTGNVYLGIWIKNTTFYLGTNSPISFRKKVEE